MFIDTPGILYRSGTTTTRSALLPLVADKQGDCRHHVLGWRIQRSRRDFHRQPGARSIRGFSRFVRQSGWNVLSLIPPSYLTACLKGLN